MKAFLTHIWYWFKYYHDKRDRRRYGYDEKKANNTNTSFFAMAVFQSIGLIPFLVTIQFYTGYKVQDKFFDFFFTKLMSINIVVFYIGMISLLFFIAVINRLIVFRNTNKEQINAYFSSLSPKQLLASKIFFFTYIVSTFAALFFSMSKIEPRKQKSNNTIYKQKQKLYNLHTKTQFYAKHYTPSIFTLSI